jgi:hypothetical protein
MTLIAAFWCAGDQAVLCADSMESYGDTKTSVTKIRPREIAQGKYQFAYGGSGYGDLVDSLEEALEITLDGSAATDAKGLQAEIQKTLAQFGADPIP